MRHADFIEKKRHGSPEFPIEYYYLDQHHQPYVMKSHWHKEFEIIRVLSGTLTVHLANNCFSLYEGDTLLVEPRTLHTGEPKNCRYECLVFDLAMLKRLKNDVTEKYISPIINSRYTITQPSQDNDVLTCVNALFNCFSNPEDFYELEVYSRLFSLFATLYRKGYIAKANTPPKNLQSQKIVNLIDLIDTNFTDPLTLTELSKVFEISPKYLCRIFKEYTGKTIFDYINELRIESACYEIRIKNKTVTQAAFDNGFNNLSYFCKVFKKHTGQTPREYKTSQK